MAGSHSHRQQDFIKCQGTELLSRLPATARQGLRHYEVAALLDDFTPQPPLAGPRLAGKRFWTVVVTDWQLYVLPGSPPRGAAAASSLLHMPLLDLDDVVGDQHDSGDYVNDSRGAVSAFSILLYPASSSKGARSDGAGRPGSPEAPAPASRVGAEAQAGRSSSQPGTPWYRRLLPGRPSGSAGTGSSVLEVQGGQGQPPLGAAGSSRSVLALLTVERHSTLLYHITKSWLGAHMRAALSQVPAPGLPLWLVPNNTQLVQGDEEAAGPVARGGRLSPQPSAQVVATPGVMSASGEQLRMIAGLITPRASSSQVPELQSLPAAGPAPQAGARGRSRGSLALLGAISEQQEQPAGAGGQRQQRRSRLSFDLGRPAGAGPGTGRAAAGPASAAAAAGGGGGMWENDAQLEARITRHRRTGSLGQPAEQAPHAACFTPVDPAYAEELSRVMLKRGTGYRSELRGGPGIMQQHASAGTARGSSSQLINSGGSPGRAGSMARASSSQLPWQALISDALLAAPGEPLALQYAEFIDSCSAMDARLCWAQLEQQLMRPCGLLDGEDVSTIKELCLEVCYSQGGKVRALHSLFFRSPQVLAWVTARLTAWTALCTCSSVLAQLAQRPAIQRLSQQHAGAGGEHMPLVWQPHLLPLLGLCGPGACSELDAAVAAADSAVGHAERVLTSLSSISGSTSNSPQLPPAPADIVYYADPLYLSPVSTIADELGHQQLYQRASTAATGSPGEWDLDSWDSREPTPAVARWQRLAGALLARAARTKVSVLLRWLQVQLMFSEECPHRVDWLSDKPVDLSAAGPSWSHLDCSRQIAACLVRLCALDGDWGRQPGGSGRARLIPAGPDDLLWWCQPGRSDHLADDVASVLYELLGISEQARHSCPEQHCNVVLQALLALPPPQVAALLRRLFLRLVCLLSGNATTAAMAAPSPELLLVTGIKCASLLLALLHSLPGASDAVYEEFALEVAHVLGSPAVRAAMHELGRSYMASAGAAVRAIQLATSRQEGPSSPAVRKHAPGIAGDGSGGGQQPTAACSGSAAAGTVLVQFSQSMMDGILDAVSSAEDLTGAKLLRCRVSDHCPAANTSGTLAHRGTVMWVLN